MKKRSSAADGPRVPRSAGWLLAAAAWLGVSLQALAQAPAADGPAAPETSAAAAGEPEVPQPPALPRLAVPDEVARPAGTAPVAADQPQSPPREGLRFEPSLRSTVTVTDNALFLSNTSGRSDVVIDLVPGLSVRGETSRLRLNGDFALVGRSYLRGTQDDHVFPSGNLLGSLELVRQRVFVEAGVSAVQTAIDPVRGLDGGVSDSNAQTTVQYRLSPYVQGEFAPGLRYLARSDNVLTRVWDTLPSTDARLSGNGYLGRHLVQVEQAPRRLGWRLWYQRTDSEPDYELSPHDRYELARAALLGAFNEQLTLGLRVGTERNNFAQEDLQDDTIYGAEIAWRPTERTRFDYWWEHRFFGAAWEGTFSHRTPWMAFNLTGQRDLLTSQQQLFYLPSGGSVAALLDGILTTRIPDPTQRAAAVAELIARGRLPNTVAGAMPIISNDVYRAQTISGQMAWLGPRTSLSLSAYVARTDALSGLSLVPVAPGDPVDRQHYEQRGAELACGYRLSTVDTGTVSYSRAVVESSGDAADERSVLQSYRLQWNRLLSPRTSAAFGLRYQTMRYRISQQHERESALFGGISHRF